jgi:4-hydroxybenzoate polyprenyltransferase
VLVLALYIREQGTMALYANPEFLWLACPILLFWTTRVWMLTHRGQMHEDPVVFAVRDWVSHAAGAAFLLVFLAAS